MIYKYHRIAVIGCSGSGKSTFSRRLGEVTGLPVTHLDCLFWKSGWVQEDRDIFKEKQKEILDKDSWIIDGHFKSTLEMRFQKCDIIYFFKINRVNVFLVI